MVLGEITFKYRFVPAGTKFVSAEGTRVAVGADDDNHLFPNEIAVGVGRENWTGGDPGMPAVIDHRAVDDDGLPSVAVAVLHHAEQLRQRRRDEASAMMWLVTVDRPNFDNYVAMYLARWLMKDDAAAPVFRDAGFTCDGFSAAAGAAGSNGTVNRFDWFKPDLTRFPNEMRWAVLLASFAAHTDRAGRIPCPRNRTLHSIFLAAIERGRPYATENNGAHEFFEEVRDAMQSAPPLDPLYDSVLEKSTRFAPELALLDGAVEAYARDIARARKAIVFLPTREDKFTHLYTEISGKPLLDARHEIVRDHLEFGGPGRLTQVDGLYLRDPECILVREWARHDIDNSSLRDGFTFTMIARPGRRPGSNDTDYFLSVDPNKARKCHLYPVWARLQAAEVAALRELATSQPPDPRPPAAREAYAERGRPEPHFFADPWYDGAHYSCRVVGTPSRGTLLVHGSDRELEDDKVAEIVRKELEFVVFAPPFQFRDVAARMNMAVVEKEHEVQSALEKPAHIEAGRYRFGSVVLSDVVDLGSDVFAEQTARVLWRMLHPDQGDDGPPTDLAKECCVREAEMLGIWSTSGVMIAYKSKAADSVAVLQDLFSKLAKLARGVDKLIVGNSPARPADEHHQTTAANAQSDVDTSEARVRQALQEGRDLTRIMIDVRQGFGLPGGHVIERFARRSGLFDTIDMLHDATRGEQTQSNLDLTQQLTTASVTVANVQLKVELLELIFVGIYATDLAHIIAPHVFPEQWQLAFTLIVALVLSGIAAAYLKPWKHTSVDEPPGRREPWAGRPLLFGFLAVIVAGIVYGVWSGFTNHSEQKTTAAEVNQPVNP